MIEVRHSYEILDKKITNMPLYISMLRLILANYDLPARFPHDGSESFIIVSLKNIHIAFDSLVKFFA